MRIPRRARWGLLVLPCLALGPGCGDDVTAPEIEVRRGNGDLERVGSGLRLLFPDGVEGIDAVRVELWKTSAGVLPNHCDSGAPAGTGAVLHALDDPQPIDICTHMRVEIWDLEGRRVRLVEDTPIDGPGLRYGWDGRDDAGNELPSGYYPVSAVCLDRGTKFLFDGHFYFIDGAEREQCDWPVWIRDLDPAAIGEKAEFGPFPQSFQTKKLDPFDGRQLALVNFVSPFLLRVRATGRETFEREIRLQDGTVTEVAVELAPVDPDDDKEP